MHIDVQLLDVNKYSRPGIKRQMTTKIAVHYVGNAGSTAKNNRDYFNNLKDTHITYASAHYIIGIKGEIIQCIPLDEIAYTTNSANNYSIGIECCHPSDDGVFTKETRESLIELVAYLLNKYDLDIDDIIRHYDVTRKLCPLCWASNTGDKYEDFLKFKKEVKEFMTKPADDKLLCTAVGKIVSKGYKIDFNMWKNESNMKLKYVPALIDKLGGISFLKQWGVISNIDLWVRGEYKSKHVRALLIKFAQKKC